MKITRNQLVFAVSFLVPAIAIAIASVSREGRRRAIGSVPREPAREVTPEELAGWMIEGRRDFAVVDLRARAKYDEKHIPGAVSCGSCHANKGEGRAAGATGEVDLSKKLVVYAESAKDPVELPNHLARNPRVLVLTGGFAGWGERVLSPVTFERIETPAALEAAKKHEVVRAHFSGEMPASPPPVRLRVDPVRRSPQNVVATKSEGC